MWIGTDDKECCHDQIEIAMWFGKIMKGSIHDKSEVICGEEHIIKDNVIT
jgi:hypothetical protein